MIDIFAAVLGGLISGTVGGFFGAKVAIRQNVSGSGRAAGRDDRSFNQTVEGGGNNIHVVGDFMVSAGTEEDPAKESTSVVFSVNQRDQCQSVIAHNQTAHKVILHKAHLMASADNSELWRLDKPIELPAGSPAELHFTRFRKSLSITADIEIKGERSVVRLAL